MPRESEKERISARLAPSHSLPPVVEHLLHPVDVHFLFHVAHDYSIHHADADRSSSLLFAYSFRSAGY